MVTLTSMVRKEVGRNDQIRDFFFSGGIERFADGSDVR